VGTPDGKDGDAAAAQHTEKQKQRVVGGQWLREDPEHQGDAGDARRRQAQQDQDRRFAARAVHHGAERDAQQRAAQGRAGGQQPDQQGLIARLSLSWETMGPKAETPAKPPKKPGWSTPGPHSGSIGHGTHWHRS
jgi:hypothetical protein